MNADRWRQVNALFHAALELDGAARDALLRDDGRDAIPSSRSEVQSLLARHQPDAAFLDAPAWTVAADLMLDDEPSLVGKQIGSYHDPRRDRPRRHGRRLRRARRAARPHGRAQGAAARVHARSPAPRSARARSARRRRVHARIDRHRLRARRDRRRALHRLRARAGRDAARASSRAARSRRTG